MKRSFLAILAVVAVLAVSAACFAQAGARGTAKLALKGATVTVEYGRPALKGRNVKDLLAQLGTDVWRLGSNKSTTFSTSADLTFGDVTVPKGEYSLWAQKQGDTWKLVFNKQHGQWGTDHDASQDFASVALKEETEKEPAEMVTITLEKEKGAGELSIQWGNMELSTTFNVK